MHIPDGFLDTKTWLTLNIISTVVVGYTLRKTKVNLGEKHVPFMGMLSAFIFAAQMINFPVAGGTSGHFLGGMLASILLGPLTGILIMSSVLIIQCLIFQDGGLLALGANIFNLGIIGSGLSYYIYFVLHKIFGSRKYYAIFIASWLSIFLAAFTCATELAISGLINWIKVLPPLLIIHAIIGVGEALITISAITFIRKVRPDLLELHNI